MQQGDTEAACATSATSGPFQSFWKQMFEELEAIQQGETEGAAHATSAASGPLKSFMKQRFEELEADLKKFDECGGGGNRLDELRGMSGNGSAGAACDSADPHLDDVEIFRSLVDTIDSSDDLQRKRKLQGVVTEVFSSFVQQEGIEVRRIRMLLRRLFVRATDDPAPVWCEDAVDRL
eukprot:3668585-Rhodomonas_salina.1